MTFSTDYMTARDRFRSAAARLGWTIESHATGTLGPNGDDLTLDVVIGGSPQAERTFVLSSGVHGVEGFFGSAVQLSLFERWAATGGHTPLRWVVLHAVNPFGFAWSRRADEGNVDLNRNFLPEGEPYAGAPLEYARLDELLNPEEPPMPRDGFHFELAKAAIRYSLPALKAAVAVGQYDFPRGLFFGGHEPSAAMRLFECHLPRWLAGSRDVVHIDLHTGLGRSGECRLLVDYPLTAASSSRVADLFEGEVYDTAESGRLTYRARGSLGAWCVTRALDSSYVFAYAEVGTYGPLRTLAALRSENQAHHWGAEGAPETAAAKARLREVFCPADEDWRRRSVETVQGVIERIASRLARKP